MARTYSSPSYGGHQMVQMHLGSLSAHTAAGVAKSAAMVRFMFPCDVIGFNMVCISTAEDLTNTTNFVLSHRTPADGTQCTEFGTIDLLGETCTAGQGIGFDGTVHGGTASQAFNVDEECVLEIEGTGDTASGEWLVNLEVIEKFKEADS